VLATSVGGTPDVISHGENGYLIPPDDLSALESGLITLLTDSALRTRLGTHGRQHIQLDFSIEAVANRLEKLYQHVLTAQTKSTDNILDKAV
jgi:glycosyltransferase involved in cell wall biosynthesis